MKKKILILKNDRTGDLFVSHKALNRIFGKHQNDLITVYLSDINHKFNFIFPKIRHKIFPMSLNFFSKIKILFDIITNRYSTIYILTPKNFYYYLAFIFRNIKFYGITIKLKNGNRPNTFFLKYLYKFVVIDRSQIKKRNSSYNIQESLIEKVSDQFFLNQNPNVNHSYKFPKKFDLFHYKHALFNGLLKWSLEDTCKFIENLKTKSEYLVFTSDIYNKELNSFFSNKYNSFDFILNVEKNLNNKKILFLKDVDGSDLFDLIKKSERVICPEGIMTHIGFFLKKDVIALMHFIIKSRENFIEQVVSCKEWFPPINYKFLVLKKDLSYSIKKISNRLDIYYGKFD